MNHDRVVLERTLNNEDMPEQEDYHVVIVGRSGDHVGAGIYVAGPGSRKNAIFTGEKCYQGQFKVATNVALRSNIAYSGDAEDCEAFVAKLDEMMRSASNG